MAANSRSWQPRRGSGKPANDDPDAGADLGEQRVAAATVNEPNGGDAAGRAQAGAPPRDLLEGDGDPWETRPLAGRTPRSESLLGKTVHQRSWPSRSLKARGLMRPRGCSLTS